MIGILVLRGDIPGKLKVVWDKVTIGSEHIVDCLKQGL